MDVRSVWAKAFATQAKAAAKAVKATLSKIAKAEDDPEDSEDRQRAEIDDVIANLDLDLTASQTDDLVAALQQVVADSASLGYAQVGLGDPDGDLFEQLNDRALQWATDNAADLVSGISDTTRDAVRDAVVSGLEDNLSTDEIADAIEGLGAFSDARALLIAATEISGANSQGALQGYKAAADNGVNVMKEWLPASDPCDDCAANADAGPIALDDTFPSGDDAPPGHPHCECALSPVVIDSGSGSEPEDGEDNDD